VRVIPRAGRTEIAGVRDGAVLVRLAAAPVEGAANAELIDLLARILRIPKRDITIVSGERSRSKADQHQRHESRPGSGYTGPECKLTF
jgi:uncharacterized protein (TIGR00251 family)